MTALTNASPTAALYRRSPIGARRSCRDISSEEIPGRHSRRRADQALVAVNVTLSSTPRLRTSRVAATAKTPSLKDSVRSVVLATRLLAQRPRVAEFEVQVALREKPCAAL